MTTLIQDGIWTWFNSPEILYDSAEDCLYVGVVTSTGLNELVRFNLATGQCHRVDHPTDGNLTVLGVDDHNNTAVIKLASGKILAGYSSHGVTDSAVRRSSDAPADPWQWDTRVLTLDRTDINVSDSYVQLVQVADNNNTVYEFFRRDTENQLFRTSSDEGATWSDGPEGAGTTPPTLFAVTSERPYFRYWKTSGTRIDCVCTNAHPNEATTSLYHFYIEIDATDGSREYYKTDGTLIGDDTDLPLTTTDVTLLYNGATSEAWIWDLKNIGGTLAVAFAVFPSHGTTAHEYWRGTLSGSTWSTEKVCDAGTTGTADYLYTAQVHYSGGIALDPNNVDIVYVSREYSATNFRIEAFTKSGTWSKTADLSGDTSSINARPRTVDIGGTTHVFWWSGTYTSYNSFDTTIVSTLSFTFQNTTKPSSPVWTAAEAPSGVQAYYSMHEGSGTTVSDATGTYNATAVGSPTWGNDATIHDPHVTSLTTSNHYTADSLATAMTSAGYPRWMALVFSTTDVGATLKLGMGFGLSSSTNPIFGIGIQTNAPTFYYRPNTGSQTQITLGGGSVHADGNPHCIVARINSDGTMTLQSELGYVVSGSNASVTVTYDRFTIGCLRRATASFGFPGKIYASLTGWGDVPEPSVLLNDIMDGQYSGLSAMPSGGAELACDSGVYSIAGTAVGLSVGSVLTLDAGSYVISGMEITFETVSGSTLDLDVGTYVISGTDITFSVMSVLDLDVGAYSIAGTDVAFQTMAPSELICDPGAYLISGTDVLLPVGPFPGDGSEVLDVDPGVYVISGTDVGLEGPSAFEIGLVPGTYVIAGTDVALESTASYSMGLDPGDYVISGTDVAFQTTSSFEIICENGQYLINGTDCILTISQTLSCDPGAYVISGTDLMFESEADQEIVCDPGSYIIDGTDCTLTYSEESSLRYSLGWIAQKTRRVWIAQNRRL